MLPVGTYVRIIRNPVPERYYCMNDDVRECNVFSSNMLRHTGKITKITRYSCGQYEVSIDRERYLWTDEMF